MVGPALSIYKSVAACRNCTPKYNSEKTTVAKHFELKVVWFVFNTERSTINRSSQFITRRIHFVVDIINCSLLEMRELRNVT